MVKNGRHSLKQVPWVPPKPRELCKHYLDHNLIGVSVCRELFYDCCHSFCLLYQWMASIVSAACRKNEGASLAGATHLPITLLHLWKNYQHILLSFDIILLKLYLVKNGTPVIILMWVWRRGRSSITCSLALSITGCHDGGWRRCDQKGPHHLLHRMKKLNSTVGNCLNTVNRLRGDAVISMQ